MLRQLVFARLITKTFADRLLSRITRRSRRGQCVGKHVVGLEVLAEISVSVELRVTESEVCIGGIDA